MALVGRGALEVHKKLMALESVLWVMLMATTNTRGLTIRRLVRIGMEGRKMQQVLHETDDINSNAYIQLASI